MQSTQKKYVCPFEGCASAFNRPYRLAQHRLAHINIKPFSCPEKNCTKEYTNKSHLDRHINSVHRQIELEVLFCCQFCMKKYSNRQNLKRHIERNHKDNKKIYQCDYCSKLFRKKSEINIHMYKHTGVKAYSCTVCQKEFLKSSLKNQHMKRHREYPCSDCDGKFNKWADLQTHRRNDHQWSVYICNDCGKKFKDRSGIVRHVKMHMGIPAAPVFFCPYKDCKNYYSRNSNLKQHILLIHKDQRFDCPLCPMRLSTKAKLDDHMKRHGKTVTGEIKNPKTRETGRQIRKDVNSYKFSSAMKLAGIDENDTHSLENINNGHIIFRDHFWED